MRISKLVQSAVAVPSRLPVATSRNHSSPAAISAPQGIAAAAARNSGVEGLLRGRLLAGRYEIEEVIGRGGMGIVYRGLDVKLGRQVAVKVLSASAPDEEGYAMLRARFVREARAVAGIRHPNVVAVHDQGTDPTLGIDFLVMELLEGEDLRSLVRTRGLPRLSSVLGLLRQAAAGVAAGHRTGLIHRDIKPANLFLESSGTEVRVKVLDFGIAERPRNREWTMGGAVGETLHALSPAFASPEQLRGDLGITPASDVFSLGAVAHHLLTGGRLWESLDPNRALQEMEAARASLLQDRRLRLKLRQVVAQALASHPDDRFRDARELLVALDSVQISDSVEPEPEPHTRAATPPAKVAAVQSDPSRHRDAVLTEAIQRIGTAVVLTLVAAICFLTMVSGEWNPITAAMAVLAATALMPLPGTSRGADGALRFMVLALATLVILGVMLARAVLGSVVDLLFAQIIITSIAPWLSSPTRSGMPDGGALSRDAW